MAKPIRKHRFVKVKHMGCEMNRMFVSPGRYVYVSEHQNKELGASAWEELKLDRRMGWPRISERIVTRSRWYKSEKSALYWLKKMYDKGKHLPRPYEHSAIYS